LLKFGRVVSSKRQTDMLMTILHTPIRGDVMTECGVPYPVGRL